MKRYRLEIVNNDPALGLEFEDILTIEEMQQKVKDFAPECNVDFERITNDKRCKAFKHFMPANITIAEYALLEDDKLYKSGNHVKLFISYWPI